MAHDDSQRLRPLRGGRLAFERQRLPAVQKALDWSDEAWDVEAARYAVPWERHYCLPAPEAQTG